MTIYTTPSGGRSTGHDPLQRKFKNFIIKSPIFIGEVAGTHFYKFSVYNFEISNILNRKMKRLR
jgi:hypothetical protein